MMRVALTYFSGTGNTWQVAQLYAEALSERGADVDLVPIERLAARPNGFSFEGYDWLGLGYPIHAWNAPRIVAEWLDHMPPGEGLPTFIFVTAGRGIADSLDWARHKMVLRGYDVIHAAPYYTGAYYLDRAFRETPPEQHVRRAAWIRSDVQEAVVEILAGHERQVHARGAAASPLPRIAWRAYLWGCRQVRRYFYADQRCTRCGLCVATCPTHNIALRPEPVGIEENGPLSSPLLFGDACTLCLRCVSICPEQAIQLTHRTTRCGRYLAPGFGEVLRQMASGSGRDL
ncbi:MAG: EFR1 family ferrodoxin [Anaerolineae bacterium]|nr:EFR1 family ferrodoxin [Anaerolineae bacterium]